MVAESPSGAAGILQLCRPLPWRCSDDVSASSGGLRGDDADVRLPVKALPAILFIHHESARFSSTIGMQQQRFSFTPLHERPHAGRQFATPMVCGCPVAAHMMALAMLALRMSRSSRMRTSLLLHPNVQFLSASFHTPCSSVLGPPEGGERASARAPIQLLHATGNVEHHANLLATVLPSLISSSHHINSVGSDGAKL